MTRAASEPRCPKCNSDHQEPYGYAYSHVNHVQEYRRRCKDCGHRWWFTVDARGAIQ